MSGLKFTFATLSQVIIKNKIFVPLPTPCSWVELSSNFPAVLCFDAFSMIKSDRSGPHTI